MLPLSVVVVGVHDDVGKTAQHWGGSNGVVMRSVAMKELN